MVAAAPLACLLAAVMALAGALNLAGPAFVREEFARFGLPIGARLVAGALGWFAAVLMLVPAWRSIGAGLGAVVILGVLAVLVRDGAWLRLEYPAVLLVLLLLVREALRA